ncbi:I78 family peptidase inhibitor [Ramlibacter sp.]|uniref:I78 family peptidase inhibitor n=1 Tax=Ramlibacter sp. TaxID=1917967 RepID=UPI002C7E5BDF|nr:I78 family peptidase inhibitor [Ramlibacter sp.]HWI81797.1 I78 family peptidase inhibitor [Ramlibacter sp.]
MKPDMPVSSSFALALATAAAALAGCAARPDTASMGMGESRCRAAGAQAVLGRQLDAVTAAEALRSSGGLRTRVIPPGGMVTLDHDPMRLNIEVDDRGTIRRMRCG